jgi:hypothetical protein
VSERQLVVRLFNGAVNAWEAQGTREQDQVDPEWTELIRAHLDWQAEDATAPFAITVPSATAAPGTLVKFRDGAGEQRIGIARTATHMQNLPAAANQPGTLYSVLAANTITVSS